MGQLIRTLRVPGEGSPELRLEDARDPRFRIVGESPAMQRVFTLIRRVARTASTTLITGESGTGKELVARAIVRGGPRAGWPFVALNCAAIPDTLLESELFGHERGAFTGAVATRKGKVEAAAGGTLFLDEVSDLAPLLQPKLLRVLQEREFERVGGSRPLPADVRVIAATNRNMWESVQKGKFREDLFFRLNVIAIELPPLRERGHDIRLLADHFAATSGERLGRLVERISEAAYERMMGYSWPGNVRELQNVMERGIVLGTDAVLGPDDLGPLAPGVSAAPENQPQTLQEAVRDAKRSAVLRALERTAGDRTEAALLLGIHPKHLSRLLTVLRLRPAD
ncbi:MAG TPA: sigma 54-interacting transcriptional regulator [Candidatus Sulfopaludibacter sp.]|nr:sigma 54-interacting transcriptional regulator [Candidatus Sulfopaludibacter sp.]